MQIKEETPCTTTLNNGEGLDSPKIPINKSNLFRRVKEINKKKSIVNAINSTRY